MQYTDVEFCRKVFLDKLQNAIYNKINYFKKGQVKNDKNNFIYFNIFNNKKNNNQKIIQKNFKNKK